MKPLEKTIDRVQEAWFDSNLNSTFNPNRSGPKGGHNARLIPGWSRSPSWLISRACRLVGVPTISWWDGSNPTPTRAVPTILLEKLHALFPTEY